MILNYDQNMCCTALCITDFNRGIARKEYYGELFPEIPLDMVWDQPSYYPWIPKRNKYEKHDGLVLPGYEAFELALAILCVHFKDYVCENGFENEWGEFEEDDTIHPRFWWGIWDVSDLSTVFGFTSTEDNSEMIHKYMEKFGFHGREIGDSEKYPGSVVTLWSMPARDFAMKCKEVYEDARKKYGRECGEGVGSQAA